MQRFYLFGLFVYNRLCMEQNRAVTLYKIRFKINRISLDIGGGHFLDVRRPKVNEFLFWFMPEMEWNIYTRDSQIQMGDVFVHHPLEANIWKLPDDMQRDYLDSVSKTGSNQNIPMPDTFVERIRWKLGDRITDTGSL